MLYIDAMNSWRARWVLAAGVALGAMVAMTAAAQTVDAGASAPARTYALVAAVGEQLSFVTEGRQIGSRLPPYVRRELPASGDVLNRMALHGLDDAVAKSDPGSKRLLFALPGGELDRLRPDQREDAAIAKVVAQMRDRPERQAWYRIVVVTPAYRAGELDGLASRLQGLGLFTQPIRGGTYTSDEGEIDLDRQAGVSVKQPSGEAFRSQAYVAPFSYVEVWVLDPRTMEVLDRQRQFKNTKVGDRMAGPHEAFQGLSEQFMLQQLNGTLVGAIDQAVAKSELGLKKGSVTVIPPSTGMDAGPAKP